MDRFAWKILGIGGGQDEPDAIRRLLSAASPAAHLAETGALWAGRGCRTNRGDRWLISSRVRGRLRDPDTGVGAAEK